MFDPISTAELIRSLVGGFVIGLIIGFAARRPRAWWAFAVLVLLNLASPWVMVSTRIVGIDEFTLMRGAPFLFALFTTINLSFLMRQGWVAHHLWWVSLSRT